MNTSTLRRLLPATALLCGTVAFAQDFPAKIANRIGDPGQRTANLVAIATSMSTVGLYAGRFPHADHLDDASWEMAWKQLGMLAKQIGAKAGATASSSNRALHPRSLPPRQPHLCRARR